MIEKKARELVLYRFKVWDVELGIASDYKKVYLMSFNYQDFPITPLNLPVPGGYDTSTYTSTFDVRGEISMEFKGRRINENEFVIDILIKDSDEYWYYGSLDDDWHPWRVDVKKKRLSLKKEIMGEKASLECTLEELECEMGIWERLEEI